MLWKNLKFSAVLETLHIFNREPTTGICEEHFLDRYLNKQGN